MIQSWLQIHKDTLKYIKIGPLSRKRKGSLFDSRKFSNLEQLYLSRWLMSSDLESAIANADSLLGPKLRKFVWDFHDFSEKWTDLGDKEEDWVGCLAQTAIARDHYL
jgi:hypothetical protein